MRKVMRFSSIVPLLAWWMSCSLCLQNLLLFTLDAKGKKPPYCMQHLHSTRRTTLCFFSNTTKWTIANLSMTSDLELSSGMDYFSLSVFLAAGKWQMNLSYCSQISLVCVEINLSLCIYECCTGLILWWCRVAVVEFLILLLHYLCTY